MKVILALILSALMQCLMQRPVYSQNWKSLPLPNIFKQAVPYFLNQYIGFVFDENDYAVQSQYYKTTDGGSTWKAIRYFDDNNSTIKQLYFAGMNRGYAATSNGVYETQDTGNTWRQIYRSSETINSVYAYNGKVFAYAGSGTFDNVSWGPFITSDDDGKTWDTILRKTSYSYIPILTRFELMKPNVIGNREGSVFAGNINSPNTLSLIYSTDNGKNWSTKKMDVTNTTYTTGLFVFPHCNDLLRTYVSFALNPISDLYQIAGSSDFGGTWNKLFQPIEIGGWIAGNNCVQYVSDAASDQFINNRSGSWRSQSRGVNWNFMNTGPDFDEIDDADCHNLSVVGGGAVVYAGDHPRFMTGGAQLWKTTTGGDGTLSVSMFKSQMDVKHELSNGSNDTLKAIGCDTSSIRVIFKNLSCNFALLDSLGIDGLSSEEFTFKHIHHLACDGIPDTLTIFIFPRTGAQKDITIRPRFINDEYETIDTSIKITIQSSASFGGNIYIKSDALTAKASDTLEIPLYIGSASPAPIQPNIDSVVLTYILNTDLINPVSFIPSNGVTAGPVTTTRTTASVTLHFPLNFSFTSEKELGKLRSAVYVTDTMETDIQLSGTLVSAKCASILSGTIVKFNLDRRCGDSSLLKYMKYGEVIQIASIIPNPARNSVQVELINNGSQIHYDLFDALGITRKSGAINGNSFSIDLSKLSVGNYYLRVSSEREIPVTQRIMIAK